MAAESVLICVHGYTKSEEAEERSWEEVVTGRLEQAYKLAEFLKGVGIINYLIFSGGVITNGKIEADRMYEFAKKKFPELFKLVNDVILERESKNTQENVNEIAKWASKKNAAIISISNKDHVGRLITDWAYDKVSERYIVLVSSNNEPYSKAGAEKRPIIIEPPFWAFESLEKLFDVPEDKREGVKKAIKDLLLDASK